MISNKKLIIVSFLLMNNFKSPFLLRDPGDDPDPEKFENRSGSASIENWKQDPDPGKNTGSGSETLVVITLIWTKWYRGVSVCKGFKKSFQKHRYIWFKAGSVIQPLLGWYYLWKMSLAFRLPRSPVPMLSRRLVFWQAVVSLLCSGVNMAATFDDQGFMTLSE